MRNHSNVEGHIKKILSADAKARALNEYEAMIKKKKEKTEN